MVERCDFDLQVTSQSDGRPLRPDMRVNLAEGKHVFVDSKVPLSAFLDAAGDGTTSSRRQHLPGQYARHVRTHVDQLSQQEVLEGRRVAGVRGPVPAERGVLRRRARADARPLRVRRQARRRHGHADHADRHAARDLLRLEAGRAGRDGRRGVPAGPRAARAARPDGQPVRQARPRAPHQRQRLQRDRRPPSRARCSSRPGASATCRSPSTTWLRCPASTTRCGRSRRRSWSTTRPRSSRWSAGPSASQPPEAEACGPHDPELDELVAGDLERPSGPRTRACARHRVRRGLRDADAYARFMGRFSEPLAPLFADLVGGARRPARSTSAAARACSPPSWSAATAPTGSTRSTRRPASSRLPASGARRRRAAGHRRGAALRRRRLRRGARPAGRALHEADPVAGLTEMARVTRPGGLVAACVWDHGGGRGPLSLFWAAARSGLDPAAPRGRRVRGLHGGRPRAQLMGEAGLVDVPTAGSS